MPAVGFHASHELYPPGDLLRHLRLAESAGFRVAMCSDHFHPWTPAQGNSGFSFAWMGAALQATSLPLGTVCCPTGRYHPAMVAQAAATLEQMFPGRTWLALGTGQALNEHITGESWLPPEERRARLREAVDVIRALWAGEEVTWQGRIHVASARVYSRPATPPRLLGAAITADTARWVGSWADGLLTLASDHAETRRVVEAFREGGGDGKPVYAQSAVAWHPDEAEAYRAVCANWPVAVLGREDNQNIPTPERFAKATAGVRPEDLRGKLRISSDLGQHAAWLQGDLELGLEQIYLHNVGGEPERFLEVFGAKVLPGLTQHGPTQR